MKQKVMVVVVVVVRGTDEPATALIIMNDSN
jgi:hypothetical protein